MNITERLESFASELTQTFIGDEKNCFPAPLLDHIVKSACEMRMQVGMTFLETDSTRNRVRYLFNDIQLEDIGRRFFADWGDNIAEGFTQEPILITPEYLRT